MQYGLGGDAEVKALLGKIEVHLDHIEQNMVTGAQLSIYAMVATLAVFGGGWCIIQQYLAPILKALPK